MGLHENLSGIKTISDLVVSNKVTRFAYTSDAYTQNLVQGHDVYNPDNENNIPSDSPSAMKVNTTIVDRGYRARASSLTRMLLNHIFGRTSYNLNKLNDLFNSLLGYLDGALGTASGLATLDANGRIPYSQLPESAVELKGYWDASTNTPALVDGTGDTGDEYYVSVAGTQNLGSGSQYFNVGDRVLYLDGVWKNINATAVKKVGGVAPTAEGNVPVNGAISSVFSDDLTANKALASDANGKIIAGGATATELGYLSGVTSKIQEQLDGKSSIPTNHASPDDTYGLGSSANYGHCRTTLFKVNHPEVDLANLNVFTIEAPQGLYDYYTLLWGDALGSFPNSFDLGISYNSGSSGYILSNRTDFIHITVSTDGVSYYDIPQGAVTQNDFVYFPNNFRSRDSWIIHFDQLNTLVPNLRFIKIEFMLECNIGTIAFV